MHALDLAEVGYSVRIYIPPRRRRRRPARLRQATACPFKGGASYHGVSHDGAFADDAVWYCPDPCEQVAAIRDHVSFWGDQIRVVRH